MNNQFYRTELLLGTDALEKLKKARVAVFGVGGVGGYVIEALARSGVQNLDIIDNDTVSQTNINRQIIALYSTVGRYKVDVMKERILDINPNCVVNAYKCFFLSETKNQFDFSNYDYIVDAVDTVSAKILLIELAKQNKCKIICCMGAGNKLDPTKFQIADISKTSVCPLARVMRQECKKRNLKDIKVLFSTEKPVEIKKQDENKVQEEPSAKKVTPGSVSFVPSVAGLLIAAEVIKDLLN